MYKYYYKIPTEIALEALNCCMLLATIEDGKYREFTTENGRGINALDTFRKLNDKMSVRFDENDKAYSNADALRLLKAIFAEPEKHDPATCTNRDCLYMDVVGCVAADGCAGYTTDDCGGQQ